MKEIILKYIEYLERKRKSRDLWKLYKEYKAELNNADINLGTYKTRGDYEQVDAWLPVRNSTKEKLERLRNQIKLL